MRELQVESNNGLFLSVLLQLPRHKVIWFRNLLGAQHTLPFLKHGSLLVSEREGLIPRASDCSGVEGEGR